MQRRHLLTALMLAAASLSASAQAPDWKKIRIGVEGAYPPFSEVGTDGKLKGFDIDIALALCAEMKAECTLVQQEWDGMIPALQARKFDAIVASMAITAERQKQVNFTNKYYNTPPAFGVYVLGLVAGWMLDQGGLPAMAPVPRRPAAPTEHPGGMGESSRLPPSSPGTPGPKCGRMRLQHRQGNDGHE